MQEGLRQRNRSMEGKYLFYIRLKVKAQNHTYYEVLLTELYKLAVRL